MGVKLGHAKFQPSSASGAFSNLGLNEGGVGNLVENWPYLGNCER